VPADLVKAADERAKAAVAGGVGGAAAVATTGVEGEEKTAMEL
jgi:hypothetical protein